MPARYHPLYDGLWSHPRMEGAPFEEYGFFVYLFGNPRQRPSGIYRLTDEQIVADTHLPVRRVRGYLEDLGRRQMIVRDAAWLFVIGYLKRQPKHQRLLDGVQTDIDGCTSVPVLKTFSVKYPHLRQRSDDRLATIDRPSGDLCTDLPPQSSTEQSSTEQSRAGHPDATERPLPAAAPVNGLAATFRVPATIATALNGCRRLGPVKRLREPAYWQAIVRAYPLPDYPAVILDAESYLSTPRGAKYQDLAAFLRNSIKRAYERQGGAVT